MARKDDYKMGERFSAEMAPSFPDRDTIVCKDCAFRKPGLCGESNRFCKMYKAGKPNEILFMNAPCQYYTQEKKAAE